MGIRERTEEEGRKGKDGREGGGIPVLHFVEESRREQYRAGVSTKTKGRSSNSWVLEKCMSDEVR